MSIVGLIPVTSDFIGEPLAEAEVDCVLATLLGLGLVDGLTFSLLNWLEMLSLVICRTLLSP